MQVVTGFVRFVQPGLDTWTVRNCSETQGSPLVCARRGPVQSRSGGIELRPHVQFGSDSQS